MKSLGGDTRPDEALRGESYFSFFTPQSRRSRDRRKRGGRTSRIFIILSFPPGRKRSFRLFAEEGGDPGEKDQDREQNG